jgi:transcriptional accessory protein Tex/SPT6
MNIIQFVQNQVSTTPKNIEATIKLLEDDCTIPFISRYRKDQTGNLDEVVIEQIAKRKKQFEEIVKRKESILNSIEEQQALTPELAKKIQESFDLQELEDYYLPFKKKRKTKADIARENGLEPLAKIIMAQNNDNIYYIHIKPYTYDLPFETIVDRFATSECLPISDPTSMKDNILTFMKRYAYTYVEKPKMEHEIDVMLSKKILHHLHVFFNRNQNNGTVKQKNINKNNINNQNKNKKSKNKTMKL